MTDEMIKTTIEEKLKEVEQQENEIGRAHV